MADLRDSREPIKLDDAAPVKLSEQPKPPEQPAPTAPEKKPMTEKEALGMAIGLLVLAIVIVVLRIAWAMHE